MMEKEIFERLSQMAENAEPAALVTIIESTGSVPGKTGFKMLVDLGEYPGYVGGVQLRRQRSGAVGPLKNAPK